MATNLMLGNVQYSVLEPIAFRKANGDQWVEMDGRNIAGSDLEQLTGMTTIPDARGVFLRTMNGGQNPGVGDTEGDSRTIGKYQGDTIIQHTHNFLVVDNWIGPNDTYAPVIDPRHNVNATYNSGPTAIGGAETRPRNICLYLYIKINN